MVDCRSSNQILPRRFNRNIQIVTSNHEIQYDDEVRKEILSSWIEYVTCVIPFVQGLGSGAEAHRTCDGEGRRYCSQEEK